MSESIQPSYSPNYFSLSDILATQVCTQTVLVQLVKFFSVSLLNWTGSFQKLVTALDYVLVTTIPEI
jgi:hypothetical protein